MPADNEGRRYFMSRENIPRRYYYEVDSWVRAGSWPNREDGELTEADLEKMDFAVFRIIPDGKPTAVSFETVYGPAEDWLFIEGILGYDYGEEGSRLPTAA